MTEIRRAFLWSSVGRYLEMVINLVSTVVMARLLAPADYGVAVLGASVIALAEAVRAIGGGAYLVQQKDLTSFQIQTNFTISLIATGALIVALHLMERPLSGFFGRPELASYLRVATLGFLTGPVRYQISALMSRSLAFGRIAFITTMTGAVNAFAGIVLALLGEAYMSLAWATAISAFVAMGLYLYFWREPHIFRPRLREWRSVVGFGIHDSAFGIFSQTGEAMTYFIIGRALDAGSVGLCQRAALLAFFPERVILAGVGAVALPAFAKQVSEGQSPKRDYVRVLGLITAAQWPALVTLILLADPLVRMLFGSQWHGLVPIVQVLAGALIFSFPMTLHYPILVALGAIRIVSPTMLAQTLVTISVLGVAAPYGLQTLALSTFAIVPFCSLLSLAVIYHVLKFEWFKLAAAIAPSALVTFACAAGPLAVTAVAGGQEALSFPLATAAAALAGAGWIAGLWLTRHPLLDEVMQLGAKLKGRVSLKLEGGRSPSS